MSFFGLALGGIIMQLRTVGKTIQTREKSRRARGVFVVSGSLPVRLAATKGSRKLKRSKFAFKTCRLSDDTFSGDFPDFRATFPSGIYPAKSVLS